jgi:hypothetical protein
MKRTDMTKKYFFLKISISFALLYWMIDSAVHYFGYGELQWEIIPTDINELWMRSVIFILLVGFGVLADHHTSKIAVKEAEKRDGYNSMLGTTRQMLRNFLTNMLLFRNEAENSKDYNNDVLKVFDEVINDVMAQIENYDNLREANKKITSEAEPRSALGH